MTNTINNVPRDWFDRVHALLYKVAYENTPEGLEAECLGSFIPDILSATSPAGVDGLEVVAWQDAENPLYTTAERRVMHEWAGNQYPIVELCRLSDAQAIIDGLRARCFSLVMNCAAELETASYCMTDEEAKRIAQSGADYYRKEARLSAGKEGSDG